MRPISRVRCVPAVRLSPFINTGPLYRRRVGWIPEAYLPALDTSEAYLPAQDTSEAYLPAQDTSEAYLPAQDLQQLCNSVKVLAFIDEPAERERERD